MIEQIKNDLEKLGNPETKYALQRFFKTGKGQYGEGDVFLGIKVPDQRKIARKYKGLGLGDLQRLFDSEIHEHRLVSLLILLEKYAKGDSETKKRVYETYINNTRRINNWDLVDLSAPNIVGDYLLRRNRSVLYSLAKSENLWERRISVLATFTFIRNNDFHDAMEIAEILLRDEHDLIHKAVGWMLREIGKRNQDVEEQFLEKYHTMMPRTMLRYAIEKFPEEKRRHYMVK